MQQEQGSSQSGGEGLLTTSLLAFLQSREAVRVAETAAVDELLALTRGHVVEEVLVLPRAEPRHLRQLAGV